MGGKIVYNMDALAPKHKVTINYSGKVTPSFFRNFPYLISQATGIPIYKIAENKFMWDFSSPEKIEVWCKWVAVETEVDPHARIDIIVEIKGYYYPKTQTCDIGITIKCFIRVVFEYWTVFDKKIKEQYAKTIYLSRRRYVRTAAINLVEKLERAIREQLGITQRALS